MAGIGAVVLFPVSAPVFRRLGSRDDLKVSRKTVAVAYHGAEGGRLRGVEEALGSVRPANPLDLY